MIGQPQQQQQQGFDPAGDFYETGLNLVYFVGSVVSLPIEFLLRPRHGTRCAHPFVQFGCFVFMILFACFAVFGSTVGNLIPFHHASGPTGLLNFNHFFAIYFFAGVYHNFRLWRRMVHPELEEHSRYEGPPWFFFAWLPYGNQFDFVRIVYEPIFVLLCSFTLSHLGIIDHYVAIYLGLAALMLFARNSVVWYRTWEYIRNLLDMQAQGKVIAKVVEGTATEEERASIHLSRFPKNVAPAIQKAATAELMGLPPEIQSLISPVEKSA